MVPYKAKRNTLRDQKKIPRLKKVNAIRRAAESGQTVDDMADATGLKKGSVYQVAYRNNISLSRHDRSLAAMIKALDECVDSLEKLCEIGRIRPHTFYDCYRQELNLPSDLKPYRYRPEMDKVIDKGGTLQEIGIAGGYPENTARENARLYVNHSWQYETWHKNRIKVRQEHEQEIKDKSLELQKLHEEKLKLGHILLGRANLLYKGGGWVERKAAEYIMLAKPQSHFNLGALTRLLELYEAKMKAGEKARLEDLAEYSGFSSSTVRRIRNSLDLPPFFGKRRNFSGDNLKTMREKTRSIYRLILNAVDVSFVNSINIGVIHKWIRDEKKPGRRILYRVGYSYLNYRQASQIYEAEDAGIRRYGDIAEMLDTRIEIVRFAVENKGRISQKLIKAFRIHYGDKNYNKPYKKITPPSPYLLSLIKKQ